MTVGELMERLTAYDAGEQVQCGIMHRGPIKIGEISDVELVGPAVLGGLHTVVIWHYSQFTPERT